MGLVIFILRWTHVLLSVRAAHKAVREARHPSTGRAARRVLSETSGRRPRARRRREEQRAEPLRAVLTRLFVLILFQRVERLMDSIGQWVPFYDMAKTLLLFWLLVSHDFAAAQLFHGILEPMVTPYEGVIDAVTFRTVRILQGLKFLALLIVAHASGHVPASVTEAINSTWTRITAFTTWIRQKMTAVKDARPDEAPSAFDGSTRLTAARGSYSPPPFDIHGTSSNLHDERITATLPGSWRPMPSPIKLSRPSLPQNWLPASSVQEHVQATASAARRVVSSNENGPSSHHPSRRYHTYTLPRSNGNASATASVKALSRLPSVPKQEPTPSSSRVRLMPDWPESPQPAQDVREASDGVPASLGRPPSPPHALAKAVSRTPPSSRQRAASTSNGDSGRKRKKRDDADDGDFDEFESTRNAGSSRRTTRPNDTATLKSERRAAPGTSRAAVQPKTAASRGGNANGTKKAPRGPGDENEGRLAPPARKRTRKAGTDVKAGSPSVEEQQENDSDNAADLPASASKRTLRARPQRGSSSASSPPLSPPLPSSSRTTSTRPKAAARPKMKKEDGRTETSTTQAKAKSSTAGSVRRQALHGVATARAKPATTRAGASASGTKGEDPAGPRKGTLRPSRTRTGTGPR